MADPARSWPAAAIFDLDGTLIDSVGDIADVLNACLAEERLATLDEPTVATMVGGGARLLIERALARLAVSVPAAMVDRMHRRFEERYLTLGAGRSTVFPGGRELIAAFRARGVKLAICTNKPAAVTREVLRGLDLAGDFQAVVGETPALPRKPHPAMIEAVLGHLGVHASDAVMIGDTSADIDAAKAAGVATIAVDFGYGTTPATALGADAVASSLSDVSVILKSMAQRPA